MGDKSVKTIADIAQLAGVSKSTVSRALNDSPLIGQDTKVRIRKIADDHFFQINNVARCLSMQQSRTIGFVSHAYHYKDSSYSVTDLFLLEIIGAISSTLANNDYDLLMAHVDPFDTEWPHRYLDNCKVDGMILMTSTRKQYHIKTLLEMKAPFIVWGYPPTEYSYCSVMGDNAAGGRVAAGRAAPAAVGTLVAALCIAIKVDDMSGLAVGSCAPVAAGGADWLPQPARSSAAPNAAAQTMMVWL